MFLPVLSRRDVENIFEGAGKMQLVLVAHLLADFIDGHVRQL